MSRGIPQVNAITLEQLKSYCFQNSYQPISYSQSYDLYAITRNSFLTYHNNALYIGYYTPILQAYWKNMISPKMELTDQYRR